MDSVGFPLVSVISVNFNQTKVTREFLHSVLAVNYPSVEIIVVDNGSADTSISELPAEFPSVQFIFTGKNLGFAGGNNVGIEASGGKYLMFLNNDTIVPPGFLQPLVQLMEQDRSIGMISPKVLFDDGKTIQYAGAKGINALTGRGKRLGLMEVDNGQYNNIYQTDLGHGAALMVSRDVIEKIGLMPEEYFLYYEEHDWCEKAKRSGYKMFYNGTTSVVHKESVSTGGDDSYLKVYYINRNRILFMRRNFSGLKSFVGVAFVVFISIPKKALSYLIKGKIGLVKALLNGLFWNFTNLRVR